MKKKLLSLLLATAMIMGLAACGTAGNTDNSVSGNAEAAQTEWNTDNTIVYGSNDYVRINPAMDEHGEINALIFDGLTDHDGNNQVIPRLAKSWDYDEETYTYTFHLEENVKWHDGEAFTAEDVKFTIETIMDPENESENAADYEDVEEIIYAFLTIFLYLLKCPQSLILSALRAFCFCGKPHISRSIFLYFRYQTWLKSW